MQFFLPLMLIIYLQMGGENTKKSKEETLPEIRGWTRIIVETDEENPVTIATITADETDMADGYRVRFRPVYERQGRKGGQS